MKALNYLSLVCLILGIAMCAAFGSRLTPSTFQRQTIAVQVEKLKSLTKTRQNQIKTSQDQLKDRQTSTQRSNADVDELKAKMRVDLGQLKTLETSLREALRKLPKRQPPNERLTAWWSLTEWPFVLGCGLISTQRSNADVDELKAKMRVDSGQLKTLETQLREARRRLPKRQPPNERLIAWWMLAGWPFALGCGLILIGSLMARRGAQEQPTQTTTGGEVLDLGVALIQLHDMLEQMNARLQTIASSEDTQVGIIRDELITIQQEKLVPIIESRARAQASLGLSRYADIFGLISQGERRLNRAWAALVDGHLGEAKYSLEGAASSWRQAADQLGEEY